MSSRVPDRTVQFSMSVGRIMNVRRLDFLIRYRTDATTRSGRQVGREKAHILKARTVSKVCFIIYLFTNTGDHAMR